MSNLGSLKTGVPGIIYRGTEDRSSVPIPVEPAVRPIHCPLFFGFAAKGGDDDAYMVAGKTFEDTYGMETMDVRGKYATHTTPFIQRCNQEANIFMFKRLRPAGAATARIRLWLDVVAAPVQQYQRLNGMFVYDENGAKIPVAGSTVPGHKVSWVARKVDDGEPAMQAATPRPGLMSEGAEQSVMYPIMDIEMQSFGAYGNNTGFRIWAATTLGQDPADSDLYTDQKAYIYRFQVMERASSTESPVTKRTLQDDPYVEFAFKQDVVDPSLGNDMYINDVIQPSYQDLETRNNGVPTFGPFRTVYVYDDHIETVTELLFEAEYLANPDAFTDDSSLYQFNLFGAYDVNGIPYYATDLLGALDNKLEFTSTATHYLINGDDGELTPEEYERLVGIELDNFTTNGIQFDNLAKYPFSFFYDTGFTIENKMRIPKILPIRSNVHVTVATHVVNERLSVSEENARALMLGAAIRAYPESIDFGTRTCRATLIGSSGKIKTSRYRNYLPLSFELMVKRCRYMGGADMRFRNGFNYYIKGVKNIAFMWDVNNTMRSFPAKSRSWEYGLIYPENYDTNDTAFNQYQTVYGDPTSVLNPDLNTIIVGDLNYICFEVWRDLVNDISLTNLDFIQQSNAEIIRIVSNRYDGLVEIVPDTKFTDNDLKRGFSWTCEIHMYGGTSKLVKQAHVITHRREDLIASNTATIS